ncbi:MAG: arylesterase [Sulfurimonas sp.]|nr:arylesterase [Sulfurimonas sp.]
MNKIKFTAILVFIALSFLIFTDKNQNDASITLKSSATILAFGDSITYGYRVSKDSSYPSQLEKKTGLHVINAGVSGEETSEGLLRLPELLKQKPDLVILCHGGNDILRKRSHDKLKNNLLAMINLIKASGAKVLLVGVPDFNLFGFKALALYSEIAEESGVMLEDDILPFVESDRSLKIDRIHPNEKGYELLAEAFMEHITLSQ